MGAGRKVKGGGFAKEVAAGTTTDGGAGLVGAVSTWPWLFLGDDREARDSVVVN